MPHSDPESPDDGARAGRGATTEQRLAEVVAAYRDLQAENEGYRERVSRNFERRFAERHERLLLRFIDILDNLDRALDASELNHTGGAMIEGLILVRTQLLQTLQEEGLERTPVVGVAYDPEVGEAVGTQPVDDPDHHHVVMKDIRRGYRLNGKLARAAQVIVGEYTGELPREPEPEAVPEDSGRVEVVGDGAESTGEIAALAARVAAEIEASEGTSDDRGDEESDDPDDAGMLDGVDLEAAAREAAAMAEGEEEEEASGTLEETDAVTPESEEEEDTDFASDVDLEAAAREAAAMAAGESDDGEDALAEDNEAISLDDDETSGDSPDGLISDEESLEQAAREAAALVGEDDPDADETPDPVEATTDPESAPPATADEEQPGRKPRKLPSHPLDDVDPSAFEEPEADD